MSLTSRLDAYLAENDLRAVWFAGPNGFAWLTGGGDSVVDRGGDVGVAAAGYDGDGVTVVTNNIEANRLRAEELDEGVAIETFEWYEASLAEAVASVSPTPAAADFGVADFSSVDAGELRQPLTGRQIEQYRDLSADAAAAIESVAGGASADDTERAVAAELRHELSTRGVESPVALVGSAARAQRYRHYTPKEEPLGEYALLSVTAQRDGLHTSCTRTVAFDPPEWLEERTRKAMRVETTALAATRAVAEEGGTAADVFAAIQDAYDAVGWNGEWRNHHQGGAAGFAGREWIATPDGDAPVAVPQGYAYNPTIRGAKSEDTHLVTGGGVELLSETGDWPTRDVSAVGYDLELSRHDALSR
ncbi:M24 family metallopeptidase [Haloarcula nitratireducens]|uniref:M24 family metallopeptidase n=1 Tax=Haloarcula nitratireducens TaxID=2487749 RepID=A0AAW4P7V4_9EURY|nr:M24 family metallopeptidase [Halomicroarcula nitratireducens]MBX0294126.1 M24 family metallopeptidase [Halomicroarcula nitratireducens]